MNKTVHLDLPQLKYLPAVAKAPGSSWVPSVLMGTRPYESFTFWGDSVLLHFCEPTALDCHAFTKWLRLQTDTY